MTTQTVQPGMVTYTDPSGQRRIGQAGEQVDLHADDLKRFDKANGGEPEDKPAAKKQAPAKKAAPAKKTAPTKKR